MSFQDLGLCAALTRAVADQNYTQPTPVQQQAIPAVLDRRDLLVGAQTGTGKTAAFTLPMLQLLNDGRHRANRRPVRALVLTPTRELAAQVASSVETYGQHLLLRSAVIFGGVNIRPQIAKLRKGVDIVVATPGRLLDHMGQGTIDLTRVEILVLDEADRMLDMGFIHDIKRVLKVLPSSRQNLLFSATFSREIKQLAGRLLNRPATITVARQNAPADGVEQRVHPVDRSRKRELLSWLITEEQWQQVLVFTRTKHGANRLTKQLERDGIRSAAIHGNKSQNARTNALSSFKRGNVRVLVATDIAARGLDIDQLSHVVNFELPHVPEDYVHRIGRTGRAGRVGNAVSLVSSEEHAQLRGIERLLQTSVERHVVPGFEPSAEAAPAAVASRRSYGPRRRQGSRTRSRR